MENRDLPIRARAEILDVPPYKQGRSVTNGFKLSSNENPFAPLPEVQEAFTAMAPRLGRYGAPPMTELREKIAARFGGSATVDNVYLGAGSVMILVQLLHAVAGPGDNFVYPWPSFEAYPTLGFIQGAEARPVPLREDHTHDADAMLKAIDERTRAVIVCTPNNPTATTLTAADFKRIIEGVPSDVLVILDEAYYEFVQDADAVRGEDVFGKYPNLVVLRTFSKAYGLATLRIGYGIGDPAIWALAGQVAVPLGVSLPAEAAASRVLDEDVRERMEALFAQLNERRERLVAGLQELGIEPAKSEANFIWIPTAPGIEPETVAEAFAERGSSVRPFIGHGTRITVGEEESIDLVVDVFRELLAKAGK